MFPSSAGCHAFVIPSEMLPHQCGTTVVVSAFYIAFEYWEGTQRHGYTNQGQLFGDWMGREDKGGQDRVTYHLNGNEWLQVNVRNQRPPRTLSLVVPL